jgi:hypothetical protein
MKALLICPSIRPAVPQLAKDGPLAGVPILGECIASHWLEYLASLGATCVQVVAPDRAPQMQAALGDGGRWGVQLEVLAGGAEPTPDEARARYRPAGEPGWLPAPFDAVLMDRLPGCPGLPLFESYASWFAALIGWMPRALTPARLRVREIGPGIWVGRRAHVSPKAELIAPCWVGDQSFVEPGAIIGPDAIIEDRCVVEAEARIARSWVGPDTFVGPMTSVASSLAWGSRLSNWESDSSLRVPDPFLLCSLSNPIGPPDRAVKAPARPALSPLQRIATWPVQVRSAQPSDPRVWAPDQLP